ncbi:ribulose-phosphate 3-epimerase, partial [Patescibacteria group bacterium]|nr:ribulose-phosphate 3-epimerase [Patescibacteria group bacterium]
IAMDGGIDHDSIKLASEAGVNIFVVGSALFGVSDVKENYLRLIERLR